MFQVCARSALRESMRAGHFAGAVCVHRDNVWAPLAGLSARAAVVRAHVIRYCVAAMHELDVTDDGRLHRSGQGLRFEQDVHRQLDISHVDLRGCGDVLKVAQPAEGGCGHIDLRPPQWVHGHAGTDRLCTRAIAIRLQVFCADVLIQPELQPVNPAVDADVTSRNVRSDVG